MTKRFRVILVAAVLSGVVSTVFQSLAILLGAAAEELGLSYSELGGIASIYSFGSAIAALLSMLWINLIDRRIAGFASFALFSGTLIALSYSTGGYVVLLLGFLAVGAGAGTLYNIAIVVIAEAYGTSRDFAIRMGAETLLAAVAVITLSNWVFPEFGFLKGIGIMGWALSGVCILILFLPHKTKVPEQTSNESIEPGHAIPNVYIYIGLAGTFLSMTGLVGPYTFLERIGVEAGLSSAEVGRLFSIGLVAGLAGCSIAGILGDRLGKAVPHLISLVSIVGVLICLAHGGKAPFAIAAISLPAILAYVVTYQMSIVAEIAQGTRWSAGIGPALMFGLAVGPIPAGMLSDMAGFGMALGFSGLLVTVATSFFTIIAKKASNQSGAVLLNNGRLTT